MTASVSGNWSDNTTWGGEPVPTLTDDVIINHGVKVIVDTTATCNTLSFTTLNDVSAETSVSISGTNSLTVTGAINLAQAVANSLVQSNNIIDVGQGTLTAGSIALKGVGQAQYRLTKITASTGTINVAGNITSMGISSRLVFSEAGTLNVGGTFMSGTAGTFTSGTSTVNFNADGNQTISPFPYSFYNLTLSGSGVKTLTNATINGILTITGSATTSGTYTSLSNMAITNRASKLIYTVGDTLNISGLVVTITYGDGTTQTANITSENISGFDSSLPATDQILTVTIGDKIATYTIDVVAPLSSDKSITSFKLRQIAIGVIDQENHTISVIVPYGTDVMNMDTIIEVSDGATVSPLSGATLDFTNPVTYTVTAADHSTQDYIITVTPITLSHIDITHRANKLTYYINEPLNISGLVVVGTYSDSSIKEEIITSNNISGFNSSLLATDQILTITVGDKTTTYTVDIKRKSSGGGGSGSLIKATPAIPAIPAIPKVSPAIPATPAIPSPSAGKALGESEVMLTKTLIFGMRDNEINLLQSYLNTHNFQVALSGPGSLGYETNYFGLLTKQAVIKFQLANGLVGDGVVGPKTRAFLK